MGNQQSLLGMQTPSARIERRLGSAALPAARPQGHVPARASTTALGPKSVTFGCRLNALEAEAMRAYAADAGLDDAVIVNTCAVTAEAVRQGAQSIRRLRRENPSARLIVTGCAAQIDPARFA